MMIISEGCAHGFQAILPDSELLYLHTERYMAEAEHGVAWNDPRVAIRWPLPLPPEGGLSERDSSFPMLSANFRGIGR